MSVEAEASSSCVSDRCSDAACGAEGLTEPEYRSAQFVLCAEPTEEDETNSLSSEPSFAQDSMFEHYSTEESDSSSEEAGTGQHNPEYRFWQDCSGKS